LNAAASVFTKEDRLAIVDRRGGMERVAVLGGGAAGVVVAAELSRRGAEVHLFEKAPALGGLHRSVAVDGLHFDIGAFTFSRRHDLVKAFPMLERILVPVSMRERSVTPGGFIDSYPVSLRGYLRDHGLVRTGADLAEMLVARLRSSHPRSVPGYAGRWLGRSIYERSGLKSYVERLNGIPDHEVGWEFVEQRLRAIEDAGPSWRIRRAFARLQRRDDAGMLVRPRAGFSAMYAEIGRELSQLGVRIMTGADIREVTREAAGSFVVRSVNDKERYSRVVSTIPIPSMMALVGFAPRGEYRQRALVTLFYRGCLRCGDATELYNFTHQAAWKRIAIHSAYYGREGGDDYFAVEVPVGTPAADSVGLAADDFERHAGGLGILAPGTRRVGDAITPRAYPVFLRDESHKIEADRRAMKEFGIDLVGRQGAFEYLSSARVAARASELAAQIAG
jgi:protoporphyrinogen oxidase